jgi:hypothetical protein
MDTISPHPKKLELIKLRPVDTEMGYRLGDQGIRVELPAGARDFSVGPTKPLMQWILETLFTMSKAAGA